MLVSKLTIAVLTLSAGVALAAPPVARVIGAQALDVDGIPVPQGNPTPVSIGSEVATKSGVAVLQFRDGSSVAVQPNSAVRLEGQAASPQVRIVRGTAAYSITAKSRLKIVDSKGETLNRLLEHAMPQAGLSADPGMQIDAAAMYRAGNRGPGGVAPTTAIAIGQFTGAGVFHAQAGGTSAAILTPSGMRIGLTAQPNGTYVISSVTVTVTLPSGQTAPVSLPASAISQLIGATVQGVNTGTAAGSAVEIQVVPAQGGNPISSGQITQILQTGANTAVQAGINNGTLPNGTTPPTPTPIKTGNFSPGPA